MFDSIVLKKNSSMISANELKKVQIIGPFQ